MKPDFSSGRAARPTARDFLLARRLCEEWLGSSRPSRAGLLAIAARYWPEFSPAGQSDLPACLLDRLAEYVDPTPEQLSQHCEELIKRWRASTVFGRQEDRV